ncbi:MAG: hypothetical protein JKY54_08585 [Flavobacteriales bacterium]|nr:hypothetical protein [Flavobacteriales bacterium]
MVRFIFITVLFISLTSLAHGQTIEELYHQKNYTELIKHENKANDLTNDELYFVGYAFFQLENDKKAIKMYDLAIKKGMDNDIIYLYKGLSLRFDNQLKKSVEFFRLAVQRNPARQKNHTELGNAFYFMKDYDSALVYFKQAREMEFENGDPYFKIPNIYSIQGDDETALKESYISLKLINKSDPTYQRLLLSVGQLECEVTQDYAKSVAAYSELISIAPKNYDVYGKLIRTYNAAENRTAADSVFNILKLKYEKNELNEEYQEFGSVSVGKFMWNGQKVVTYKYFKTPEETLDIMYKTHVISKDGKSVERTFMTEKCLQLRDDGPAHILCEKGKEGTHYTYSYGWSEENMNYSAIMKTVVLALDGKIKPGASSNFGAKSSKKSKKKKSR